MLVAWVMSRHYFHASIVEWEITTVVIVNAPAFDVETLEVRITDEGLVHTYMKSINDWLFLKIKVSNQAIEIIFFKNKQLALSHFCFRKPITKCFFIGLKFYR